ncbi:MAG TPA: 3-hydroxyacyl-CoA dehydrogenase NAD-binding domain-containing protein [Geminicoccaceae bacterium]|nr:3-hydroxyacyl-CoA dehydrogenase NAD-binding domain-containing protein [Geminicoccaceae bacterium]
MAQPGPEVIEQVAVIGAGAIGASWATLFLAHGLSVAVYDPAPDTERKVRDFIARAWPTMARLGLAARADPDRLGFHADPADAVQGASVVQESGPENLAAKQALFARLEQGLAPDAIVASSTSGLLPSDLQAGRIGPGRYLVAHPFNPPHLMPLVELVGGRDTDPAVIERAAAFYRSIGKRPIAIRREMPGHVANRMQAALYREAIHLALEGVASIEDIDAAISYGPGLRWAFMGPHMLHHLAGGERGLRHLLEHIGPGLQSWWNDLGRPDLTPEVIDRLVGMFEAADPRSIQDLAAERDALLLALLESLAEARRGREGQG